MSTGPVASRVASRGDDARLETLYEAVPCGITVRDGTGRIVFANSAVKRILRADVDPSEGRLWMPSRARTREDGSDLPPSETPGAIAVRTGEPIRDFAMRVTRIDGTECWLLVDAVPLKDETGRIERVVTSFIDITERKRLEAHLEHRALHDQLTGLPNRWLFLDRIAQSLSLAKRAERAGPALLFADLDGFKALNDRCGHAAGDAMLREASHRFRSVLRDSDTVARIGGDEFGVLLPLAEHVDEVAAVSHKFETALEAPWAFRGNYGVLIGAARDAGDGMEYWRLTQFVLPFWTMTGPYGENPTRHTRAWVPMDDESVMVLAVTFDPLRPLTEAELARGREGGGAGYVGEKNFLPPTSAPGGAWRPKASMENDYFLDRERQRTELFTGIPEFWAQDAAMQEGMGRIFDRTREHLGTSDLGIIRVRQRLIKAAKALAEEGLVPASTLDPSLYRVRGAATLLPPRSKWLEDTEDLRKVIPGVNPAGV